MKRLVQRVLRRWVPHRLKMALIQGSSRNLMDCALRLLKDRGLEPPLIVDVGAYVGGWSAAASRTFPGARILMIEAQSDKEPHLAGIVRRNPRAAYRIALLGAAPQKSVRFHKMESGSSLYAEETAVARNELDLPMTTLDEVAGEQGFLDGTAGALLKLDVQGAEIDVLRGATRLLERTAAVVMEVSLVEYNRGAPILADVVRFMNERGFVVHDLAGLHRVGTVLIQVDLVFVPAGSPLRQGWKR